MNRRQRIRLVVAIAVGLISLFMAFIGGPLIASTFWPPDFMDLESWNAIQRVAEITNVASRYFLVVTGICCVYVFVALAVTFIGPPEKPKDQTP